MKTTTMRISESSRKTLREISRRDNKPVQAVLEQALEAYRRQRFLEGLSTDFAALRENEPEWEAEQAERSDWDTALGDGKPVLAVLPWDLYEAITETLELMGDKETMEQLRQSVQEMERGATLSWNDAKLKLK